VVDVFCDGVIPHLSGAFGRGVIMSDLVESIAQSLEFIGRENTCCRDGGGMGFAGGYFFLEELPVKDDRSLPCFKLWVEWLAKAA
jgi:hypothetical protein